MANLINLAKILEGTIVGPSMCLFNLLILTLYTLVIGNVTRPGTLNKDVPHVVEEPFQGTSNEPTRFQGGDVITF